MNKKSLLVIHQEPFGYHSDTYYYCKYLKTKFDITYICWDYNKKKIHMPGIRIIYISRKGNLPIRNFRFIFSVLDEIKTRYDFHFIKYFKGSSLLRLLSGKQNFLLDIRSGSILAKEWKRLALNFTMKTETKCFPHVSVISKGLRDRLGLDRETYILPLGADPISTNNKPFDTLKLLYVGTLYNRNMEQTIQGFSKFYHEFKSRTNIQYTIVGSGFDNEEAQLKALVKSENIEDAVTIAGYIPHDELKPYFDEYNIGISYIPRTEYFDVQPPTKNYEYLLSGMAVLATNTQENRTVITPKNGILINDTPEDFYRGLIQLYVNRQIYDSQEIRANAMPYTWEKIVTRLNHRLNAIIK